MKKNVCSIYHQKFEALKQVAGSAQKATLLDKFVFWWQISSYTLQDNQTWFTRSYEQIASEMCISIRTVNRYIKSFEDDGLIERKTKLSACNKEQFKVLKRTYIRITDKLLNLLKEPRPNTNTNTQTVKTAAVNNTSATTKECANIQQHGTIENANLSLSIYKVKDHNLVNNTISEICSNQFVNNPKPLKTTPFKYDALIGERVEEDIKKTVKGMLFNIQNSHKVAISNPEQVYAEIIFSISNNQQWKQGQTMQHRINIISSLLRKKLWKTPKGFFKYWDVGVMLAEKQQMKEEAYLAQKKSEIDSYQRKGFRDIASLYTTDNFKQQHTHLQNIEKDIFNKGSRIEQLTQALHENADEDIREQYRQDISVLKTALDELYQQQKNIEQQLSTEMEVHYDDAMIA